MSYSAMYVLPEGGDMLEDSLEHAVYRNSKGTGIAIWGALWTKYLEDDYGRFSLLKDLQPLWDLRMNSQLPHSDVFVLLSTFDGCIIKPEAMEFLAKSFEAFSEEHREYLEGKVWHGPAIAEDFRSVRNAHPDKCAFLMMTSVSGIVGNEDPFYIP